MGFFNHSVAIEMLKPLLQTIFASRTDAVFQDTVDSGARIGQGHDILMDGLIDEVRIYARALSSSEIQQHYAESVPRHNLALK